MVKRARQCGLHLEKIFYQRALVLLRPWGNDQVAISTIYKALRTIDTESPSPSLSVCAWLKCECRSVRTPCLCFTQKSGSSSFALPQPRDLVGDSGRSTPGSHSSSSHPPSSSQSRASLSGVYDTTSEIPTKPGILALLEVYTESVLYVCLGV